MRKNKIRSTIVLIFFYLGNFTLVRTVDNLILRYSAGFLIGTILFTYFKNNILFKVKNEIKEFKKNFYSGLKMFFLFYFVLLVLALILFLIEDFNQSGKEGKLIYEGSLNLIEIMFIIIFVPLFEEIYFRFLLDFYIKFKIRINFVRNIIISGLFSLTHTHGQLRLFFWSLFVTYTYQKKNSLIQVVIFHILTIIFYYTCVYFFAEF